MRLCPFKTIKKFLDPRKYPATQDKATEIKIAFGECEVSCMAFQQGECILLKNGNNYNYREI